jgi:hypothetical protein
VTTCRNCGKPIVRCHPEGMTCGIGWLHSVVSTLQSDDHYCYPERKVDGVRAMAEPVEAS